MSAQLPTPALPCPECRRAGRGGDARIGNRRDICTTCNRFSQRVMRMTRSRLKSAHEQEYEIIRLRVEKDLYPFFIEQDIRKHPVRDPADILLDDEGMEILPGERKN